MASALKKVTQIPVNAQFIIDKYNLKAGSYYTENPYKSQSEKDDESKTWNRELQLNEKFKSHIPSGWYGISLGSPVPLIWYDAIEELLDSLILERPELEIYQIKVKFGGLRIYLGGISEENQKEVGKLEWVMFDKLLVY